jgi:hypothetical protein
MVILSVAAIAVPSAGGPAPVSVSRKKRTFELGGRYNQNFDNSRYVKLYLLAPYGQRIPRYLQGAHGTVQIDRPTPASLTQA